MKVTLSCLFTLIIFYSCTKPNQERIYQEDRVYVGSWANFRETTIVSLSAVGHLNQPTMIKPPTHAVYSAFGNDPIGGNMYYYSPEQNFTGTDTVIFKSFESRINTTIISTYFIKIRE